MKDILSWLDGLGAPVKVLVVIALALVLGGAAIGVAGREAALRPASRNQIDGIIERLDRIEERQQAGAEQLAAVRAQIDAFQAVTVRIDQRLDRFDDRVNFLVSPMGERARR